ncbi:MAG: hypothetical protein KJO12_05645 [Ignavibacteria bacterium]|nr:hypothetical protein [Ignavibacteria bacterium]
MCREDAKTVSGKKPKHGCHSNHNNSIEEVTRELKILREQVTEKINLNDDNNKYIAKTVALGSLVMSAFVLSLVYFVLYMFDVDELKTKIIMFSVSCLVYMLSIYAFGLTSYILCIKK